MFFFVCFDTVGPAVTKGEKGILKKNIIKKVKKIGAKTTKRRAAKRVIKIIIFANYLLTRFRKRVCFYFLISFASKIDRFSIIIIIYTRYSTLWAYTGNYLFSYIKEPFKEKTYNFFTP